jgi:hypothetical protein
MLAVANYFTHVFMHHHSSSSRGIVILLSKGREGGAGC